MPLKTPLKSIKNRIDIVSLYEGYKHIKKQKQALTTMNSFQMAKNE